MKTTKMSELEVKMFDNMRERIKCYEKIQKLMFEMDELRLELMKEA